MSAVPQDLTPLKHAKRLRINMTTDGYSDINEVYSPPVYEHDDHAIWDARKAYLADFLASSAPKLECFETNWAPIFGTKGCLPRFACMRVGFEQECI